MRIRHLLWGLVGAVLALPVHASDEVSDLQNQLKERDEEIARLKRDKDATELDREVEAYLEASEEAAKDAPFAGGHAGDQQPADRARPDRWRAARPADKVPHVLELKPGHPGARE